MISLVGNFHENDTLQTAAVMKPGQWFGLVQLCMPEQPENM